VVSKAGVTVYDMVSGCCLMQNEQFFSYHGENKLIFNDEVRFVLDQHAELDLYSASSPKQQSAGRHVAPIL
jgi:hypothetical protein